MPTSSSISSSEKPADSADIITFAKRLALFLIPCFLVVIAVVGGGTISGELLPVETAAEIQTSGSPVLFLPKFSDHNFAYKAAATLERKPDILALGASRANQWRSAMFPGASFYNASQAVYSFHDYSQFLRRMGDYSPKVIIVSIDFYDFDPSYNSARGQLNQSSLDPFDVTSWPPLLPLVSSLLTDPWAIIDYREPIYRVPAFGLSARRFGNGFRNDGSFQYGLEISGNSAFAVTIENALQRVATGAGPFGFGENLDSKAVADLEEFLDLAKSRGIQVIGVAMPYDPKLVEGLNLSPNHQRWREFRSPWLRSWLGERGVPYFDFSDIASFDGRPDEFVDPFHPSEPAVIRALIKMADDPTVRSILDINKEDLALRLVDSTQYEVYRNAF